MSSFDPTKSLNQLMVEAGDSETPEVIKPSKPGSLNELMDQVEKQSDESQLDASTGELNKTLVASPSGRVALFSNPPTGIEMASTDEPAPFLPPHKVNTEVSLNELLNRVEQGTDEDAPVSAEILPQDARLQLQSNPVIPVTRTQQATAFGTGLVEGGAAVLAAHLTSKAGMLGGVFLAGGPGSSAAPILGTIGAGAGGAIGFEATLKGFDALLGNSADGGLEVAKYIRDAKKSSPGYYQAGMLLPLVPTGIGSIKGMLSAGSTVAQMGNKLEGAKTIAKQLGYGALGGATFSGGAQVINKVLDDKEFDASQLAFDTLLGSLFAGNGLKGVSAEYSGKNWEDMVSRLAKGTATPDEKSDLNAILGAEWRGRIADHFKNNVKGSTDTIYGDIPITEKEAQAAMGRVSLGKGTSKDYASLSGLLPKIAESQGLVSAKVLGINQGDVRAYSDVTLQEPNRVGPGSGAGVLIPGGGPQLPYAPLTSRAVASSNLEQNVAEGLKPITNPDGQLETTPGEVLTNDEEIDLQSLLPNPEINNEQKSPTSQDESVNPQGGANDESGPTYGQQVLRRIADPSQQSGETSPYDVDNSELAGAGVIGNGGELNFSKPGRPAKIDTGLESQKPLAIDQELPVINEQGNSPDTGLEAQKPLATDQALPVVNKQGDEPDTGLESQKPLAIDQALNFNKQGRPAKIDTGLESQKPLASHVDLEFSGPSPATPYNTNSTVSRDLFGEVNGTAPMQGDLDFNRSGRPAKIFKDVKPTAKQTELNFEKAGTAQPYTTLLPENKLTHEDLFSKVKVPDGISGAGSIGPDPTIQRSIYYAAELYLTKIREEMKADGKLRDDSLLYPEDLRIPELADKIIPYLKQSNNVWPEDAVGQANYMRALNEAITLMWKKPKGTTETNVDGLPEQAQELGENLATNVTQALSSLNADLERLQRNTPQPIKRLPRVAQPGSRVTSEIRLSEESPEYTEALDKLPESPNEAKNLEVAEKFFRNSASNLKRNKPALSVDESRLASSARLRYWRQLRRKYDLRKNRTENLVAGEAEEIFLNQDLPKISKTRIFRSVVEDYSRKLGRRLGGKIGLEAALSLQMALGPDDGSGTLEDNIASPATNLDQNEVRLDLLKNAKNAFFATLDRGTGEAFLLGAALADKSGDPKAFAKNSTELAKISANLNQQGLKTSVGQLAKALPKLVDQFIGFVSEKTKADTDTFLKTGGLPAIIPGYLKNFKVLSEKVNQPRLTEYDKKIQELARDKLSELEEQEFLNPVEVANVRDKLDLSPRAGAAFRAIQEMQSILASKQPGVGITEPTLKLVSGANPEVVPNLIPTTFNLLPHQRAGANLIVNAYKEGRTAALLADDAGLGKGRTFLSAARVIADDKAKARNEPHGKIIVLTESNELIDAAMGGLKSQLSSANIPRSRTYFHTYDAYSKDSIKGIETADVIVFDEGQNLKNSSAIRTKMSKQTTAFKIFSSATPADRFVGAMYFLPGILGKSETTVRAMLDVSKDKVTTLYNLLESAATVGAYVRRVPLGSRPSANQVNMEAGPDIQSQILRIENFYRQQISDIRGDNTSEMSGAQRDQILKLEGLIKFKTEAWAEITKAPFIIESAIEDLKNGKQVIVFGEYVNSISFPELGYREVPSLLQTLDKEFTEGGFPTAILFGEGGNQMTADINDFQNGSKLIALATPTKAGAGLSLDDQAGDAPRVVYIATPNEAADKHDQMLHRAGHRISSRSIPEIKELIATDIYTDGQRLRNREAKQAMLEASQGSIPDDESGQIGLPFGGATRIDRNTMPELKPDDSPLLNEDLQISVRRTASVNKNGQKVDERYSRLPLHEQGIINDLTQALSDLKFKNVKILFGDKGGNMSAWVPWESPDFNTIYVNPRILLNNRDGVGQSWKGKISDAGKGYLIGIASEEMLHNSLYAVVRNLSSQLHFDRINSKEVTAQEAYLETMQFILDKTYEEIDPAAKVALAAKYGTELTDRQLTVEYIRYIHQLARLGYTTEDFNPKNGGEEALRDLLKGAPKDGYIAFWFKAMRQALMDLLNRTGLTIRDSKMFGGLLDAVDNVLYHLEKYGPNAPPEHNEAIASLLRVVSPESEYKLNVSKGSPRVSGNTTELSKISKEIRRGKNLKTKPEKSILEFGNTQSVRDAFGREHTFRYAWVDRSKVQASHLGSSKYFSSNPRYTGVNQRNYSFSASDKAKILRIEGADFNAKQIVNDGAGAPNQGLPLLAFDKAVGEWMVVAGNAREQVTGTAFKDEGRRGDLLELALELTNRFGGKAPADVGSGNWFLYRVMEEQMDTSSPDGLERLNSLIKETNSEGGSELTHLDKAEVDFKNISEAPSASRALGNLAIDIPDLDRNSAQTFLSKLAELRVINVDERNALLSPTAGQTPVEYVQYLILRKYLQPLERHGSLKNTIPGSEMVKEIMDQGNAKKLYLLLAQTSAASEILGEEEAAKYKAFCSRIANQMLTSKGIGLHPLQSLKGLLINNSQLLNEGGAPTRNYKEVAANPDFSALVRFAVNTIAPTTRMVKGKTTYTAKSVTIFNVILDELGRTMAENTKQGNAEDMFQLTPIQKAIEAVDSRIRSSERDGEDVEAYEFAGAGVMPESNSFELQQETLREKIKAAKAELTSLKKIKGLEEYDKQRVKERESIQKPALLFGEDVVNEETDYTSRDYIDQDPFNEMGDADYYEGMDANLAEEEASTEQYASNFEYIAARRGSAFVSGDKGIGEYAFEKHGENLADLSVFDEKPLDDSQPTQQGFSSRTEYNKLLSALQSAGLEKYFKLKKLIEVIARDEAWLEETVEQAQREGDLKKFWAGLSGDNRLIEPAYRTKALQDPIISIVFGPLSKALEVTKTTSRIISYEDKAIKTLVAAQEATKQILQFLDAIGNPERTKEIRDIAEQAQAAYEIFKQKGVSIPDTTSTDADWDSVAKKWTDKKERKLLPPTKLDKEYRAKLKKTIRLLDQRSLLTATLTPDNFTRLKQFESELRGVAKQISEIKTTIAEANVEMIRLGGLFEEAGNKQKFAVLVGQQDDRAKALKQMRVLREELTELVYRGNKIQQASKLQVKSDSKGVRLTEKQTNNLSPAVVSELKRRGLIMEFLETTPLYEKTIEWVIPKNFIGLNNKQPQTISAQVIYQEIKAQGWVKDAITGEYQIPTPHQGRGMIVKFNTTKNTSGDYRNPVFTNGKTIPTEICEYAASSYYMTPKALGITRYQGTEPTIRYVLPVVPDIAAINRAELKPQAQPAKEEVRIIGMKAKSVLLKREPLLDERGRYSWEFQLNPQLPEFKSTSLGTSPSKLFKGKLYGGTASGMLSTTNSKGRAIHIRARTADEALALAIEKLGEAGDIYYKNKWYGKNIAVSTQRVEEDLEIPDDGKGQTSNSQRQVRQALYERRMDYLQAAIEKGRASENSFDFVVRREVEAYLTAKFEQGAPINDPEVVKLGIQFGFMTYRKGGFNTQGLAKIQASALLRSTPKSMSTINNGNRTSATGPSRDVSQNFLFGGKPKKLEVPTEKRQYAVPEGRLRTSEEVLATIAKDNGVSVEDLKKANSLVMGKAVVGSQLLIPGTTKSVEVGSFFVQPEKLTALDIATRNGVTKAEMLSYNRLPEDYVPKPGDILEFQGSSHKNNLQDLVFKILKNRDHVTYPQMLFKNRAPQGTQLIDRDGSVSGTAPMSSAFSDETNEYIFTDETKLNVSNAASGADQEDLARGVQEIVEKIMGKGDSKTTVRVTVDKTNNRILIESQGVSMSKKAVTDLMLAQFEGDQDRVRTSLASVVATSNITMLAVDRGDVTFLKTTPQELLAEGSQPSVVTDVGYGLETGVESGVHVTIDLLKSVDLANDYTKNLTYYMPNIFDFELVKKKAGQELSYTEVGPNAKSTTIVGKAIPSQSFDETPKVKGSIVKKNVATKSAYYELATLFIDGAPLYPTQARSRNAALGNIAARMVKDKYPYRGVTYKSIGLLRYQLTEDIQAGRLALRFGRSDQYAGAGPIEGAKREQSLKGLAESKQREGRAKTQGFAGQLSSDSRLGEELRSASALRDFKYAVRTHPIRVEEMMNLIQRVGGAEAVANVLLSPDIEVRDDDLRAIRDGSTTHFDNTVTLNNVLIQQLEKAALENPSRADEIRAIQFALAKKQANLGTSLAQGLKAFGAFSRIGAAGWLWFAANAKQVSRLRQVGLFGSDIEKGKLAGDQAVENALQKVFSSPEIERVTSLIDKAANNGIWAQLLLRAQRIASTSAEWQNISTATLSTVLDDQVKTAKDMIALLKDAQESVEKKKQLGSTVAEGTAALLQKGVASASEVATELGVSEKSVLENIEEAQDVLDEAQETTSGEIQNHLWKRFGNSTMVDLDGDVAGAGSMRPHKDVGVASQRIIENVLKGFIDNFEKALNVKDPEGKLPKETAVGVIRRILRERVQLQANGALKLTRSKLSKEQRKLLSVRRFREAMNSWESLAQAVEIIYQQLAGSMDEGSYEKIVEAMQLAMDEPFTAADVRAYMTLPEFNFKDFVFSRRYKLTSKKAEILSELAKELRASGIEVKDELLNRVLTKVSEEMDNLSKLEFEKSMTRLFGKNENKATRVIRENVSGIIKAALAGNLSEATIYGFIAKKLKLQDQDWLPGKEVSSKIKKLAEEIVNDPNGPNSRRAASKTLDILDEIKKDAGISVLEAFVGQFYTNILQGVRTISVNLLSPIGNSLNLLTILGSRAVREKNFSSFSVVRKAIPRALNNALVEVVDLLATGDSSGKSLAPGKTLSTRVSGRALPELMAEGGVRINANSAFGRGIANLAEMWFGWNQRGFWPKVPISKGVWDGAFKLVRKGAKVIGVGTIRAPEYSGAPIVQVSPTGVGLLISRLYNSLDIGSTTFYSELFASLAAKDAVAELQHTNPEGTRNLTPNQLLASDLGSLLRLGRSIAGRDEKLPHGMEGPSVVRELEKEAEQARRERLKPGTLPFRQELYLNSRRNRGIGNPYWQKVWNRGSTAEKTEIDRIIGTITDDAFFLGSLLANTNRPIGVLGKLAKLLETWSNDHLLAKLVQPFYGIVTSVYQNWLDWVGTGVIKSMSNTVEVHGEGKRQKPSDMVAMQFGTGMLGLGFLAAGLAVIIARMLGDENKREEGFIDFSGKGPIDLAYRQSLIDSKMWQPDSIKIGNMWFKNPNWSPTYLVFKALGYISDYSKYEKPNQAASSEVAMQFTLAALKSVGAGVLDVPFLGGVKTLSDLSNLESSSWDRKVVGFLLKTGSSLAFGNLYAETDRKIFPEKRDRFGNVHTATGLMAMALGNIPFLRNFNKPMTNVLGEPMLSDGANLPENNWDRAKQVMFNYGDIALRYRDNPDILWSELARKKAWISLPDTMVRVHGVVLNDEQRDDWVLERARVLREKVRDPSWVKSLPDRDSGDVQNEVSRLTSRANKSADILVLNKYELWDKASERKQLSREIGPRNLD